MKRLAPYGLVIGAAYFGLEVGWRWGRRVFEAQMRQAQERALNEHPLAYLVHLREEFGDLTYSSTEEQRRTNCGYCGADAEAGVLVAADGWTHIEGPTHHEHCPYYIR